MKTLVFVWTFKDVSFLVIVGGLILWVAYLIISSYIEACIEEWKEKRSKKKEEEDV